MRTKKEKLSGQTKQGISLIVLVITIIVMIILAAAIILSLSSNGIIDRANEAVDKTDKAQIQNLASLAWSEAYLNGARTQGELDYVVAERLKSIDTTGYTILVSENGVDVIEFNPDNWDVAYAYTDAGWSDRITAGNPVEGIIVAKFYKTGRQIDPPDFTFRGLDVKLDKDDEYIMVIEGSGNMTDMMTTLPSDPSKITGGVGWQYETALVAAGYAQTAIIGYVSQIKIQEGITSIGYYAFLGAASLNKISIPSSITNIDDSAFSMCASLDNVTLPTGMTSIEPGSFFRCISLRSITIPSGVESIGEEVFSGCDNLTNVTIPNSVTSIDDYAFAKCNGLKTVNYTGTEEQWEQITIGSSNYDLTDAIINYNYVAN